ncbi:unnamed protein product [Caenorhabditis auriculariae]|uniref:Glutaredoxin domain-containing protein n=1 Tax=Caenorhabditis auriculariae TaxID=2777116 RepID=A0A8S1H4Y6_9PELO|nr:unnamed protein product [Caenorhabditis auriculariae]
MYTKTFCGFCTKAKNLLTDVKIPYKEVNLDTLKKELADQEYTSRVNGLVYTTHQTTVPQIFICGKFVGGFTELDTMRKAGKLLEAVAQCSGENSSKEE